MAEYNEENSTTPTTNKPVQITEVIEFDNTQKSMKNQIETLRDADFSMDNYREKSREVHASLSTTDSHISKTLAQLLNKRIKITKLYSNPRLNEYLTTAPILKNIKNELEDKNALLEDAFAWSHLQVIQMRVLISKLMKVLASYRDMEMDIEQVKAQNKLAVNFSDQIQANTLLTEKILTKKVDSEVDFIERRLKRLENIIFLNKVELDIEIPQKPIEPIEQPTVEPVETEPQSSEESLPKKEEKEEKKEKESGFDDRDADWDD